MNVSQVYKSDQSTKLAVVGQYSASHMVSAVHLCHLFTPVSCSTMLSPTAHVLCLVVLKKQLLRIHHRFGFHGWSAAEHGFISTNSSRASSKVLEQNYLLPLNLFNTLSSFLIEPICHYFIFHMWSATEHKFIGCSISYARLPTGGSRASSEVLEQDYLLPLNLFSTLSSFLIKPICHYFMDDLQLNTNS